MKSKWSEYLHRIRERELEIIFKKVPAGTFSNVLELGAGDGFQSTILKNYCKKLFCTEYDKERLINRNFEDVLYIICDAEELPFPENSFDLIFSSNMLEHIKDREKCISEMKRVLKEGGIMIHTMPNRKWKILQVLLYYPSLLLSVNTKKLKRIISGKEIDKKVKNSELDSSKRDCKPSIPRYITPPLHGVYKNHLDEFLSYDRNSWTSLFESNDLVVHRVIKLPLCSGYGFGFDRLRLIGEKIGLSSSYAYVITKTGRYSLKYF